MNRAEKRNQKRKEVVEAVVVRKEPVGLVARVFNISQRTVFDWLARYRQGGWHGLEEKSRHGRPKKISGDDLKWLYDAITMGHPLNYKLPFCLWSLQTIRTLLHQERGLLLSKSSLCRLLHHLGLSPQRPLYKSYKKPREGQNLPHRNLSGSGAASPKTSRPPVFSGRSGLSQRCAPGDDLGQARGDAGRQRQRRTLRFQVDQCRFRARRPAF